MGRKKVGNATFIPALDLGNSGSDYLTNLKVRVTNVENVLSKGKQEA